MIGRLTGKLAHEDPDGRIIVDVGGVGYEVATPLGTARRAASGSEPGQVTLFVHTQMREDALELFGFASEADRQLFRMLLSVQKIGPRLALVLLSALSSEELAKAIGTSDVTRLCRVPGIGRKTAERLVLELKEKVTLAAASGPGVLGRPIDRSAQLVGALVSMGYKAPEAERAVKSLGSAADAQPMAESLRAALGILTQRRGV